MKARLVKHGSAGGHVQIPLCRSCSRWLQMLSCQQKDSHRHGTATKQPSTAEQQHLHADRHGQRPLRPTLVSVPSTTASAAVAASSSALACAPPSSDLPRVCSLSSTPAASRAASASGSSSAAAARQEGAVGNG